MYEYRSRRRRNPLLAEFMDWLYPAVEPVIAEEPLEPQGLTKKLPPSQKKGMGKKKKR